MKNLMNLNDSKLNARNFGLDLARALAIILVLLSHGRILIPDFPGRILFSNGGYFGVELFFVLSGFLIGSILIKMIENNDVLNWKAIKGFWIRRWFRTVPNYILFLTLNITLFQFLFGEKSYDIKYFFFLQNFRWAIPTLMPESWSLSIEEWFYITLPLVILVSSVISASKKKMMLASIIFYISLFTLLRFYEVINNNPSWDTDLRKVVFYRLDSIGYGVLTAYTDFYHRDFLLRHKQRMYKLSILSLGILIILFSYYSLTTRETFFNKTLLFSFTSISLAVLLPWFKDLKCQNGTVIKCVRYISIISYSMYLVHFSFVLPLLQTFLFRKMPWQIVYILYFLLTMVISSFVYTFFEKPMTNLREKFRDAKSIYSEPK